MSLLNNLAKILSALHLVVLVVGYTVSGWMEDPIQFYQSFYGETIVPPGVLPEPSRTALEHMSMTLTQREYDGSSKNNAALFSNEAIHSSFFSHTSPLDVWPADILGGVGVACSSIQHGTGTFKLHQYSWCRTSCSHSLDQHLEVWWHYIPVRRLDAFSIWYIVSAGSLVCTTRLDNFQAHSSVCRMQKLGRHLWKSCRLEHVPRLDESNALLHVCVRSISVL